MNREIKCDILLIQQKLFKMRLISKTLIKIASMLQKNIFTFKNLPVQQKHRKWTDCICTIITPIFALTLFILSFVFFTRENYFKVNFPFDNLAKLCAYHHPQVKLIYFQNSNNLNSARYCVKSCPSTGDAFLAIKTGKLRKPVLQLKQVATILKQLLTDLEHSVCLSIIRQVCISQQL